MNQQIKQIKKQAGYFMVGMSIALLAASLVTIGGAKTSLNTWKENIGSGLGNQLQTVNNALVSYISANSTKLIANTAIPLPAPGVGNVADIYSPTIDELKSLGNLNIAASATPTAGNAYVIKISLTPDGCTTNCTPTGYVYLQNPIYGPDGKVADIRLLSSAMNASTTNQVGFSLSDGVSPSSPAITGNGWTFPNPDPTQRPGILYATTNLSSVPSTTQYWLKPVATKADLPTSGNSDGDGRFALDTGKPYKWSSLTSTWSELFSEKGGVSIGEGSGSATLTNVFIGPGSGYSNTSGATNVFNGYQSGYSNTTGYGNVFNGYYSGYSNTSGIYNNFNGFESGVNNTTGSNNVFSGLTSGRSNSTGSNNIFSGYRAGYSNTTGSNNIFSGSQSGYSNTTGLANIFIGINAGYFNTIGMYNNFLGAYSGHGNTEGSYNNFTGKDSGRNNTTGDYNSFYGHFTGDSNTTGSYNSFFGALSGSSNTSGSSNIFMGRGSGGGNLTGNHNIFLGTNAGTNNKTSHNNIFIGQLAGNTSQNTTTQGGSNVYIGYAADGAPGVSNATAIGFFAIAPASNSVRIGNASVTQIAGHVAWSSDSDKRLKTDIKTSTRGLEFVRKLRPVDYTLIQNKRHETGFIAQEVEEIDSSFPGVNKPANDKDFYSLAYTDFIPSIVKSIQELDSRMDKPKAQSKVFDAPIWIIGFLLALLSAVSAWLLAQNRKLKSDIADIKVALLGNGILV